VDYDGCLMPTDTRASRFGPHSAQECRGHNIHGEEKQTARPTQRGDRKERDGQTQRPYVLSPFNLFS